MNIEELNNYRLTSMEEPTDEMLALIMKEVSEEAARENHAAKERYFQRMKSVTINHRRVWKERIERTAHHG